MNGGILGFTHNFKRFNSINYQLLLFKLEGKGYTLGGLSNLAFNCYFILFHAATGPSLVAERVTLPSFESFARFLHTESATR